MERRERFIEKQTLSGFCFKEAHRVQWEVLAVVSKWTHLCHADSLHPSPNIALHLPQVMPLLQNHLLWPSTGFFCLAALQHLNWKGERRDQNPRHAAKPNNEISQKHPTLDFKLKEGYLKRASQNWLPYPQKAMLWIIQSVTHFPDPKSNCIEGRKHTSAFMMGRMFFCFKYQV